MRKDLKRTTTLKGETRRLRFSAFFTISFTLLILIPSLLLAQQGYLHLSFRHRSHILGSSWNYLYPQTENEYENIWHVDLFQKTFNYGQFQGWFDGRLLDSTLQAAHWYLNWQDLKIGPFSLGLNFGDYNFQFTTIGYRFTNYYPSFHYLRGVTASLNHQKFGFNFFTGRMARLSGLMGLVYSLTDQTAAGFLAHFKPNDRYYFGLGFVHSENETDWTGKLLTRGNNLFLFESEIQLNERIKLVAESKTSATILANESEKKFGHSLRFGPFFNFDRWALEINYRRVEADFRGLRSDFILDQDQEGLFTSFRYQPKRGLYLFSTLDYYHDNVGETEAKNTTDFFQTYAGFSLISPTWPNINFRLEFKRAESRLYAEDYQHFLTPGFYLELAKKFNRFDPYIRIRYRYHDDRVNEPRDYNLPSFYLGLRYNYLRGAYILIEVEDSRYYDYLEKLSWSLKKGRLIHYSPFWFNTDVYSEIVFSEHKTWNHYISSSKRLELYLGLQKSLPWHLNLRLDFRSTWYLTSKQPAHYWLTFKVDRRFNWGESPRYQGRTAGLIITGIGQIEGLIFSDQNLNGQFDTEDKIFADISFFLEDGSQAFSDQKGKFIFNRVPEGLHSVSVDFRAIPADFYLLSPENQSVVVEKRKTTKVVFRLVEAATAGGLIYQDVNKNGLLDQEDILMKNVLIILKPRSTEQLPATAKEIIPSEFTAYTNDQGQFLFENILPGIYELSIDEETLPYGVKIQVDLPLKIELKPGQKIKDLQIRCLPRSVIYINHGKDNRVTIPCT